MQDWDSEIYSKNSSLQYAGAIAFFNEHIKTFREEPLNILDIGCGDGKVTKEISLILGNSRVLGIDNSSSMIEHASDNHANGESLKFAKVDASEINFQEIFDLIVSFYCLQWISNKRNLFNRIFNALKENRSISLLIMPVIYPHYIEIMDIMMQQSRWQHIYYAHRYEHPHRKFSDSNYSQYAIDSGLQLIKAEIFPEKFIFKSKEEFCNFLSSVMPTFLHFDQDEKKSFVSELADRYKDCEQSNEWIYRYYNYRLVAKRGSSL